MSRKAMLWPLTGLVVMGVVALAASAGGHEEEVTLEQVPPAVQATILAESAGGRITEIERETRNGAVVYEAEFLLDGQEIEIRIAPDGTLLGRHVEGLARGAGRLTIDQVPEPARGALLQLAGGAPILKAERERARGALIYEAEWTRNGTRHEAAVTQEGALIELEETIPPESAPAAVRAVIADHFGPDVPVVIEKKMIVVYELEARINGREKEILVFPTGQVHDHGDDDDDEDEDDEDEDDDDDDDHEEDDDD